MQVTMQQFWLGLKKLVCEYESAGDFSSLKPNLLLIVLIHLLSINSHITPSLNPNRFPIKSSLLIFAILFIFFARSVLLVQRGMITDMLKLPILN